MLSFASFKVQESYYDVMNGADDIAEKLQCLDYEDHFIKARKQHPLNKEQLFLPSSNTALQFQYFLELVSWLFTLIQEKNDVFRIDNYDDPNTIVHKVMIRLREAGFDEDFPATKLKIPYGECIVKSLDFLTDVACDRIVKNNREIKYVGVYQNGILKENETLDDSLDEIFDETSNNTDTDSEPDENNFSMNSASDSVMNANVEFSGNNIIKNSIDPIAWRDELERVGSRLKGKPHSFYQFFFSIENVDDHTPYSSSPP